MTASAPEYFAVLRSFTGLWAGKLSLHFCAALAEPCGTTLATRLRLSRKWRVREAAVAVEFPRSIAVPLLECATLSASPRGTGATGEPPGNRPQWVGEGRGQTRNLEA